MSEPRVLLVRTDDDPAGALIDWLAEAGLAVVDATGPDTPASLDGYAALVVVGGPASPTDDAAAPWLGGLRQLLRDVVAGELPTLGIGFGAHLLALAHGGRMTANPGGPEYGAQLVAKRSAAAHDPLFRPLPIAPDVIQWHADTVVTLPAGAIELASSPVCDNQAFRVGRLAWGLHFHVETSPETVRRWARQDASALAGYDVDAILRRVDAVHPELAEVWRPFVHDFVGVVRDPGSVPPPRGVPTSVAAPLTDPAAIRAALAAEAQAARAPLLPMPTLRPRDDE